MKAGTNPYARLPSVDRLLDRSEVAELTALHGRMAVMGALRDQLAAVRDDLRRSPDRPVDVGAIVAATAARLEAAAQPSLRPVFNLTGTVLHTNLGRAWLAEEAVAAVRAVMSQSCNLEFDMDSAGRGDRDDHVEALLTEFTGAEAATVVNNNAAAVYLILNTLAQRKEVIVSRGELIEIGGAFRLPDIMARAGARLREVGTTNRTHLGDFRDAMGTRTAMVMKVHRSNFAMVGFTASVPPAQLAGLAHEHGLPFVEDLGSGTLIDLAAYGLPAEPTPRAALAAGADLICFSGDKLLGGPQAGLVVGAGDLVARLKRNPLKRALRVDKLTLAALEATLRLYRTPERLPERLPTLRLLLRPESAIRDQALRLQPRVHAVLADRATIAVEACQSQIGSGSLPVDRLPSAGLALRPGGRASGTALRCLAESFRRLPVPVIGRLEGGALRFDFRCLEDEAAFVSQLGGLAS